jgi:hypothetical protein
VRTASPVSMHVRRRRSPTAARCLFLSGCCALPALALLTAHVFTPLASLQIAALWLLNASFVTIWIAIVTWRAPVFDRRVLAAFASLWAVGISLSVWLVVLSASPNRPASWQRSVQGLALGMGFAVGGLLLRALLRKRSSPVIARFLSFLSPLLILLLILFFPSGRSV